MDIVAGLRSALRDELRITAAALWKPLGATWKQPEQPPAAVPPGSLIRPLRCR
jgi:hypothetical protein